MSNRAKYIWAVILTFIGLPVLSATILTLVYRALVPDSTAPMPNWISGLNGGICGGGVPVIIGAAGRHFFKREAALLSKTITPYYAADNVFIWRDGNGSLQMITNSSAHLLIKSAKYKKRKNGDYLVTFVCKNSMADTAKYRAEISAPDLPLFAELFSEKV
ncbi:MAG: hypothetical protein LBK23_10950 [Oscillospiraceae bacterium]|jgi:hypothetical protein|nr:hypothetical protein [Oscillospiraceae bacterium]